MMMGRQAESATTDTLAEWRRQTSRRLVLVVAAVTAALLAAYGAAITAWLFWTSFGFLILLLASSRISAPVGLRVAILVLGFTFAGVVALHSANDYVAGLVYLATAMLLSVMLHSTRLGLLLLVQTTALFLLAAWADYRSIALLPPNSDLPSHVTLVGNSLLILLMGLTIVLSVHYLMSRLQQALAEQLDAMNELREESAERLEAHRSLKAAQLNLVSASKMEVLAHLAGGIAHDMNNVLTIVLAEASRLKKTQPDTAANLSAAVEHATSLTRQLLAIGRSDVIQPRNISVRAVVEQCAKLLGRSLRDDVEVTTDSVEDLSVLADPNQLQQVLLNLGTNAGHAMPRGGKLEFGARTRGERVEIEVRDSGEGMDAAKLERIFEPFYTTKAASLGSGLGLSSAHAIVEALGGSIRCESRVGIGSSFFIELPLAAASSDPPPGEVDVGAASQQLHGLRVLVVEDDIRVRATVVSMLSDAGAQVVDAGDPEGAIALSSIQDRPFDLVWTDAVMPRGGARALLSWLEEKHPALPVLICTGYADDPELRRDVFAGRYTLLRKPFTVAEAVKACGNALERSSKRSAPPPSERAPV